jgi:hypothetical protein
MAEEQRDSISLVLVAEELRLMNGESLANRLAPILPSAKLLLMSGRAVSRPTGSGAPCLPTPCTDQELIARVRQVLGASP